MILPVHNLNSIKVNRSIAFQSCSTVDSCLNNKMFPGGNSATFCSSAEELINDIYCSELSVTPEEIQTISKKIAHTTEILYGSYDNNDVASINTDDIKIQVSAIFDGLSTNDRNKLQKIAQRYEALDDSEKELFKLQLIKLIANSQKELLKGVNVNNREKIKNLFENANNFSRLSGCEQKEVLRTIACISKEFNKQNVNFGGIPHRIACLGVTGIIGGEFALAALYLFSCGNIGANTNLATAILGDIVGSMALLVSVSFIYAGCKFASN